MRLVTLLAFFGILVIATSAGAQSPVNVELQPNRDSTLIMASDGSLSSGGSIYIFTGRTNQPPGQDLRRGLVRFDVASAVPAGATINNVTLRLRVSRTMTSANTVRLHRVLADWGEGVASGQGAGGGQGSPAQSGDATWLHRFYPNILWTTPGGDFAATASAARDVGGIGFYEWTSPGLVMDVEHWLMNPSSNHGWIIIGDESYHQSTKRFDSRHHATIGNRPRLTINYTPPALVGACCMSDGMCMTTTSANCAAQGGTYQGDGTICSPNPCPQPPATGACCLSMMGCMQMTEMDCMMAGGAYHGDGVPCTPDPCGVVLEKFVDVLPIPAVAQPVTGRPGGPAHYAIPVRQFQQQLHRDLPPTTVWGYGDSPSFPGPTIEAKSGQTVTVTWINDLRDAAGNLLKSHYLHVDHCLHGPHQHGSKPRTVVHLHGAHVGPESDGHPEDAILPGEQHTYTYPNLQLPATLWYHDHALGITRLNVVMGLAGFYLLRDDFEAGLNLPAGGYEIPLAIQDRSFNHDGSLQYPHMWMDHFFGDKILVNGKVWPYLEVKRGKYRFRVLNGSGSRTYTLSLSNGQVFHQIGTDGGMLGAPVALKELTLMPGERADLVMDFAGLSPGTHVVLMNSAPAPYPGEHGHDDMGVVPEVMKFIVLNETGFTGTLPAVLRPVVPLPVSEAVAHRDLTLRAYPDACTGMRWTINGLGWDDITEFPQLGTVEVWRFINRSNVSHPMHIHLVQFQVLDRQDFELVNGQPVPVGEPMPPPPNEAGWKDTVQAHPNQITRVIARFEGYTGAFSYHCHILEHEDHEMMRQFVVRPPCPADISPMGGDLSVNVNDLLAVINAWGPCPATGFCIGDIDRNHSVNVSDLLAVLNAWGPCPR